MSYTITTHRSLYPGTPGTGPRHTVFRRRQNTEHPHTEKAEPGSEPGVLLKTAQTSENKCYVFQTRSSCTHSTGVPWVQWR